MNKIRNFMLVVAMCLALSVQVGYGNDGNKGYIGFEKAKSIALVHANVPESEIRKYEAELDRYRGRAVYKIEFDSAMIEYEYEIDAETGEIIRWKSEYD